MIGVGVGLAARTGGGMWTPGAEIADALIWPSTAGITSSPAGVSGFGRAGGVRLALRSGYSETWRRSFCVRPLLLESGGRYRAAFWFLYGSSGRFRLDTDRSDKIVLKVTTSGAAVTNVKTRRCTITEAHLSPFPPGGFQLVIDVSVDDEAGAPVAIGVGPDTTTPGEDVILLATELARR